MNLFLLSMELENNAIDHHRCHICPLIQDTAPRVPIETAPWMNLRCGHRIHTNCFLENIYKENICPIRFPCPICQEHALANNMIIWIEGVQVNGVNAIHDFNRPRIIENLWEENEEFRNDIRNLSKLQRESSAHILSHKKELIQLRQEWKTAIYSSIEFIRAQKKEFTRRLANLPFRKKAIRAINKIIFARRSIVASYPSVGWHHLKTIGNIRGAPKLRHYPRSIFWRFSRYSMFSIRI